MVESLMRKDLNEMKKEEIDRCVLCLEELSKREHGSITNRILKENKLHRKCLLNFEADNFYKSLLKKETLTTL